jgi:hypothetical protein
LTTLIRSSVRESKKERRKKKGNRQVKWRRYLLRVCFCLSVACFQVHYNRFDKARKRRKQKFISTRQAALAVSQCLMLSRVSEHLNFPLLLSIDDIDVRTVLTSVVLYLDARRQISKKERRIRNRKRILDVARIGDETEEQEEAGERERKKR